MKSAFKASLRPEHTSKMTLIENRSSTSLYKQIYLMIRNRILSGEYPNSSVLPGEIEMSRQFGVSRITTKRALNELSAEGLCIRKRGAGSIVTFNPSAGPLQSDTQGLLALLSQVSSETDGTLCELQYVPASSEIADILQVETGTETLQYVRVRNLDGKPFSYLTTSIPADISKGINSEQMDIRQL